MRKRSSLLLDDMFAAWGLMRTRYGGVIAKADQLGSTQHKRGGGAQPR